MEQEIDEIVASSLDENNKQPGMLAYISIIPNKS